MEPKLQRLQKILAAAGLASRRKAEELIAAGVVSVNGHVITEPGSKADPRMDEIRVDGKLLRGPEHHVYLALYKPKGYMTTVSDPEGRPTIMDLLKNVDERVFPVGRLDYMSEGLLLLTNDGELMAQLTRAGSHVAKTYMVKVSGKPPEEEIEKLRNGIMLPPEPGLTAVRGKKQPGVERRSFAVLTQPATIQLAVDQENPWYEVTLNEGRNRQIRRMFEQIGHHIEKIKRVRYASLTLDLEPGEFRHLTPKEVNQLRKSLETPFKPRPLKAKPGKGQRREFPGRAPRVDSARFVKGRRGKPSATPTSPVAPAAQEGTPVREFSAREYKPRDAASRGEFKPRGDFKPREERTFNSPRGPEFKRPFTKSPDDRPHKPFGERSERPSRPAGRAFEPRGERPSRPSKPFGERPRFAAGGDRRDSRGAGKPEFGRKSFDKPRFDRPRSEASEGAPNFSRPKFSKPFEDRGERRPFGDRPSRPAGRAFEPRGDRPSRPAGKTFGDRPDRKSFGPRPSRPAGSFADRPGKSFGDRKFSRGPGKPAPRGDGEFKPRSSGDFKPRNSSDFKPRSSSTGFKPRSDSPKPRGEYPKGPGGFSKARSGFSKPPSGGPKSGGFQKFIAPRGDRPTGGKRPFKGTPRRRDEE